MFCYNCGNQLKNGDRFCDKCGMPVATMEEVQETKEEAVNTAAPTPEAQSAVVENPAPAAEPLKTEEPVYTSEKAEPVAENFKAPAQDFPKTEPVNPAAPAPEAKENAYQTPPPQYAPPQYTVQKPKQEASNLMGILALICGIGSFCLGWIPFLMFIPEVLAVIFGIVGIVKKQGKGMAIAGLILAALGFVATAITSLLVVILIFGEFGSEFTHFYPWY